VTPTRAHRESAAIFFVGADKLCISEYAHLRVWIETDEMWGISGQFFSLAQLLAACDAEAYARGVEDAAKVTEDSQYGLATGLPNRVRALAAAQKEGTCRGDDA
jgi:hypothetical protein